MVMVAVRGGCVCVGGWVVGGGGCDGVLSKFLLDNSSFSTPLLIIIAQSLVGLFQLCHVYLRPVRK